MTKHIVLFAIAAAVFPARAAVVDRPATDLFALAPEETLTVPLPIPSPAPMRSFAGLPLSFVRNDGQADPATRFEVGGRGYQLSLEPTEAVMVLAGGDDGAKRLGVRRPSAAFAAAPAPHADRIATWVPDAKAPEDGRTPRPVEDPAASFHVLRMKLVGANADAAISGEEKLPGKFHYFIGNDPTLWRTNVPSFAKVRYREIYPGIDLVYYGNEGQLEYDFVVAPGADPARIELAIEGADAVTVDANGDLRLEVAGRGLTWRKPLVFQERDGERIEVAGEYVLRPARAGGDAPGVRDVAFRLAPYDRMLALVIDPVLAYSSYLGGGLSDGASAVAVDKDGCAYVTGWTWSQKNFPTTTNRIHRTFTVNEAAFVTKFSPAGDTLLYSTVLTGSDYPFGGSSGRAIQVDDDCNAVVVGYTDQGDFPTRNALQPVYGGGFSAPDHGDAFVAKLSPDGVTLVFSTYLGGSGHDQARSVALDAAGSIHVAGVTRSPDFPTLNAIQAEHGGGNSDLFVAKIAPNGGTLVYSTFLGDDHLESDSHMGLDSEGRCYVAWTTGEQIAENQWSNIVWLARLNPGGSILDFRKPNVLNGDGWINGLAVDTAGKIYLAGYTTSTTLPTTPNAFQRAFAGGYSDVFVGRLNGESLSVEYLTYLGGASGNEGLRSSAIAVDRDGHAYVVGDTESADFPTTDPIQARLHSGPASEHRDGFVTKLSSDGSRLVWSTFLGGGKAPPTGNGADEATGVALGLDGAAYVVGMTSSSDFPVLNAFQRTLRTESNWFSRDAFVTKISDAPPPALVVTRFGNTVTISWPVLAGAFQLEAANSLGTTPNWQPEPTAPEVIGDQNVVTLELGAGPRFFRLRKP